MTACSNVDLAIANLNSKVSSMQSKVSSLESRVSQLEKKSIDENSIINKAKELAISALTPSIVDAKSIAKGALNVAGVAKDLAGSVAGKIPQLISATADAAGTAAKAAKAADTALFTAKPALETAAKAARAAEAVAGDAKIAKDLANGAAQWIDISGKPAVSKLPKLTQIAQGAASVADTALSTAKPALDTAAKAAKAADTALFTAKPALETAAKAAKAAEAVASDAKIAKDLASGAAQWIDVSGKPTASRLTQVATTANNAASTAAGAASKAGALAPLAALLPIIGILVGLAGFASSIFALKILGSRIDAVEDRVQQQDGFISRLLGQFGALRQKADSAYNASVEARNVAGVAAERANLAITEANDTQATADQAMARSGTALLKANSAISKADSASNAASEAMQRSNTAITIAQNANSSIKELQPKVNTATNKAETAIATSNQTQTLLLEKPSKTEVNVIVNTKIESAASQTKQELKAADQQVKQEVKQEIKPEVREIIAQETRSIESQLSQKTDYQVKQSLAGINTGIQTYIENTARNLQNEAVKSDNAIKLKQQEITQHFDNKVQEINQKLSINQPQIQQLDNTNARLTNVETKVKQQQQQLILLERPPQQVETVNQADVNQIKQQQNQLQATVSKLASDLPGMLGIALLGMRPAATTVSSFSPAATEQIRNAAAAGVCQTTAPGGCTGRKFQQIQQGINQNNQQLNQISNAPALAGNIQNAAIQQSINGVANTVNGINSKLTGLIAAFNNFAKWMHLDRVLNIMIFAATVHNAAMLSNDLLQTLIGSITNILSLIGLKDSSGNAFNVGEIINSTVENFVKGIVGADNYTNLSNAWAKANRIYQATQNVINSFLNLSQLILMANEMIAAYTGKIGNALKKGGVVLENAYGWMNPQPKFNRVSSTLENLQQVGSTIQMVTQAPLDVISATTELTNSATEFTKAVKEDDKPQNKAPVQPEPDALKATETTAKTASQPVVFDFSDLFDGEDL